MTKNQCMSVEQMYKTLLSDGFVESNSPKNRMKLYKLLEQSDIKITKKTIGYNPSTKTISRLSGSRLSKWNTAQIIKWISTGKLPEFEVQNGCDIYNQIYAKLIQEKPEFCAKIEDIKFIFEKKLSHKEKKMLVKEKWNFILDMKTCPFDYCSLKKPIVRIELIK
ncbi:hypothetical protein [Powai lake megavirus]|uniref:Uncharacterized protein n=1 Tax=Powai lake megavirus TaxID=1842663 RepID=A0A167R9X2_9VIRU|nr:hypothetical protein QJ849_gp294 [Powai lake megavirus]ANB50456.1 hypothetical protein [Powai lake megavirus]WBF70929.1 hypothetical protein [Megavirus caiporensis]